MQNKLIKQLITYAQDKNSQQLVLEKIKQVPGCSFFKDGDYRGRLRLSEKMAEDLINSFQFLSKTLDNQLYANKRIKIKHNKKIYNCYLSLLPAGKETKTIMTLEESSLPLKRITSLGFKRQDLSRVNQALQLKQGLILIIGQSQAGKSTTYYSLLNKLNKNNQSIYSLEKYPSRELPYITTLEINDQQTIIDYLQKSRKIDADILGIDHLESPEEIAAAIEQANNGHLVIASLERSSAISALRSTLNIGLSPQTVASGLRLIIGQKLLKKNCPYCLQRRQVNKNFLEKIRKITQTNYQAKRLASSPGCSRCQFSGQAKHLAVFELMSILPNASIQANFKPFIFDALAKADNGLFSPEEILKSFK